jgi:hypothetical protein
VLPSYTLPRYSWGGFVDTPQNYKDNNESKEELLNINSGIKE